MKLLTTILAAATLAAAQQTPPAEITIAQAVETALRNYPSVRVTQEQMNAAAAAIRLAQTAYLPRVDGLLQVNRATRNTFYGLLLPQSVIPGVDGVKADNLGTVFDSGAGVLVSWQPFDFGLRRANVAVAEAARDQAQAALNKTRYEISVAAADAFLTVLAARRWIAGRSYSAVFKRWSTHNCGREPTSRESRRNWQAPRRKWLKPSRRSKSRASP